jgi:hypothetical protein
MLAIIIKRAKSEGQIKGLIPGLVDGLIPGLVDDGLSILQYADDTIFVMDNNLNQARNIKLILSAFERISSLKINFYMSEILCFGQVKDEEQQYEQLFGCGIGSYPFQYFGIPMDQDIKIRKNRRNDRKEAKQLEREILVSRW